MLHEKVVLRDFLKKINDNKLKTTRYDMSDSQNHIFFSLVDHLAYL